ncbi:MAG: MgtC/SapB family protein [Leptothrix sp. (in: b-proteobacteria)]
MDPTSLRFDLTLDPAVTGLAAALVVGLLIGLERGWQDRELADGSRVAGLRTFALIGLLGGVLAILRRDFGIWPLAAGLLGLALLGAVSYRESVRVNGSLSVTSTIAALLTYALGAMAAAGAPAHAVGVAVIVTLLLDLKPTLHGWLRHIEHRELSAALQMLVLSMVVLPLLPDQGYGPYDALNPYRLWWAVVLVSGLSLAGHVAMRLSGPQRGLLWTGLLGGLASSTAATLTLSRRARQEPGLVDAAAAGTLAACGVMFLRMTVIVMSLQPMLGRTLAAPLIASGLSLLGLGLLQWRRRPPGTPPAAATDAESPFDLSVAVGFGAFLGLMAVLSHAAHDWFGDGGLYGLALLSGLADVDAIVISVSRMHGSNGLPTAAAGLAMGLAAASNMVTKAVMAWVTGNAALGRRVVLGYAVAMAVGVATTALVLRA